MPAKIVVTSGPIKGRSFPIEQEVVRIGSRSDCDICLPDASIPPVAFQLEYLDGTYVVYNAGDGLVSLDGQQLATQGATPWPPGRELRIGRAWSFQIQVEGNASSSSSLAHRPPQKSPGPQRPSPGLTRQRNAVPAKTAGTPETPPLPRFEVRRDLAKPPSAVRDGLETEKRKRENASDSSTGTTSDGGTKTNNKATFQIAVIAACGVLLAVLFVMRSSAEPEMEKSDMVIALVEKLKSNPAPLVAEIRRELQQGLIAERQKDRQRAINHYGRAVEKLLGGGEGLSQTEREEIETLLASKLRRLE